jgi:DNA-binding transcriptional LysR family regulator
VIRIDVEHEIVSPVVEHYDIVFAMLEAPLASAGIIIKRIFSLERGLFAAPALLDRLGEPRGLEDLSRFSLLTGPTDTSWAMTTPAGRIENLPTDKARLTSSNAHIRLQAALAGLGILRVTASYTRAAVAAESLRRVLPDHLCEPLNVHALLPARQFVPAKVRCFLEAMEEHAHGAPAGQVASSPGS